MADELKIFCAKGCSPPVYKIATNFEGSTKIPVNVSTCSGQCDEPHAYKNVEAAHGSHKDMLDEINSSGEHDLVITGADYLLDDAQISGLVLKGSRKTLAYRRSAIIIQKGNPKNITEFNDILKENISLGVSTIDCLQGVWEDISAKARVVNQVRNNITLFAPGCYSIINAVADGAVDAAFGWSAFGKFESQKVDVIELPETLQVFRATSAAKLKFCTDHELADRFIQFTSTPESIKIFEQNGWVV